MMKFFEWISYLIAVSAILSMLVSAAIMIASLAAMMLASAIKSFN